MSKDKAALKIQGFFASYWLKKQNLAQQAIATNPASKLLQAFDLRFQCMRAVAAAKFPISKPIEDPAILKRIEEPYRGKILQVNLKSFGIKDFGEMTPRGMGRPMYPAGLELFFQDKPMQLARWPNNEWARIADAPKGKQGRFMYEGDRPERWMDTEDIWLHGYWTWDWADSHEKVKKIDLEKKEFVTYEPHGVYGYDKGKRYYAQNILEELDEFLFFKVYLFNLGI